MIQIAIQGLEGAFHHEAAELCFPDETVQVKPCLTFQQVVDEVESKSTPFGLMAIENTISGTILNNFNLLAESHQCAIVGEIKMRIVQCLGALKGTSTSEIQEVRSHYMALNQCQKFIAQQNYKQLTIEDTALGAQQIADLQITNAGAIASKTAMKLYGLELLEESIETNKDNYTRFFVLQHKDESTQKGNKITARVVLSHESGSLARLLTRLDNLQVNLTKLESMPILGEPWKYAFFLEAELPEQTDFTEIEDTLDQLTTAYKLLGKYPKHHDSI